MKSKFVANIYLNELDQFIKHKLKAKYYLLQHIELFLKEQLKLNLHPNKVHIRKLSYGVDFVGYVTFSRVVVLRTKTKRRILRKIINLKEDLNNKVIDKKHFNQSLQSYLGILKHCAGHKIKKEIKKIIIQNETLQLSF